MSTSSTAEHGEELLRFDAVERLAHWLTAAAFVVLIVTALPLYFVQVEALVGRRELIALIHTWTGIFLPIPIAVALVGSWGKSIRDDLKRFNNWSAEEVVWLKSKGRERMVEKGKFNPGQKLNAIFTGAVIVVMLGTGLMLKWFNFFPLNLRTGATFVHDLFATVFVVVVVGHIAFALRHPDSLKSMISGRISRSWAMRHAPEWLKEQDPPLRQGDPG